MQDFFWQCFPRPIHNTLGLYLLGLHKGKSDFSVCWFFAAWGEGFCSAFIVTIMFVIFFRNELTESKKKTENLR